MKSSINSKPPTLTERMFKFIENVRQRLRIGIKDWENDDKLTFTIFGNIYIYLMGY